jgi:DNA-directed RNA polymerase omega subunit
MSYLWRDELVRKIGSVYKLVILASYRAVELNAGAQKLVDTDSNEKVTNIALKEILEGKVALKEKQEK